MPVVGQPLAGPLGFVAPGICRLVEAAAGGGLPLGFGRQRTAGPIRVRLSIFERDMDDGMVVAAP